MRKIAIIGLIVGVLLIVLVATVPLYATSLYEPNAESIGIIGGADGPTAIYITYGILRWPAYLSILGKLFVGFFGIVLLALRKKGK